MRQTDELSNQSELIASSSGSLRGWAYLPVFCVAVLGVVASLYVGLSSHRWEQERFERQICRDAEHFSAALETSLNAHLETLLYVAELFDASDSVERDEFASFAQAAQKSHAELVLLGWLPRSPGPRASGRSGAQMSTGGIRLAYAVPTDVPALRIPTDFADQPGWRVALDEAANTGRLIAAPPFRDDAALYLWAFQPVYSSSLPHKEVVARQRAFAGWAVAVLDIESIVNRARLATAHDTLRIRLTDYDLRGEQTLVYGLEAESIASETDSPGARFDTHLAVANRRWVLTCTPSATVLAEQPRWTGVKEAVSGLLATLLLSFCWVALINQSTRIAGLVRQRTAELSAKNDALQNEVDERHRTELALRESRQMLRTVIDNIPQFVYWKDTHCRYLGCNVNYARALDLEQPTDIIGLTDDELQPNNERSRQRTTDDRHVMEVNEPAYRVTETYRGADGTPHHIESNRIPLLNADDHVVGILRTFEDITARKNLEQQRERLIEMLMSSNQRLATINEQVERSNRELQDFAYIASHDLQEPLRKVHAFADRLGAKYAEQLDGTAQDYISRMQNAASRMQSLIQDLLEFSRVTTKARPFEPVDLNQVAREVINDLETRIEESGARIDLGVLPTVEADATQIRQVLQNLIANALKFRRPDVGPVVEVRAEPVEEAAPATPWDTNRGAYRIYVQDNGIGFEPKHAERIFGMFQRLHGHSEYEGTGVGLAICRKIVERHGGEIRAEGRPGQGATFVMTLPVTQTQEEEAPCPEPQAPPSF